MCLRPIYYMFRNIMNFTKKKRLENLLDKKLKTYNKKIITIAIHGTLQTHASSFYDMFRWFDKNGVLIVPIDYSYKIPIRDAALVVKKQIKKILKQTKAKKINIIAHSYGGIVARYYIQRLNGKVNKLITIGTPHNGIRIDNIWNWMLSRFPGALHKEETSRNPVALELNKTDRFKNHVVIIGLKDKLVAPDIAEYKKAKKNIYLPDIGHIDELHCPTVFNAILKEI